MEFQDNFPYYVGLVIDSEAAPTNSSAVHNVQWEPK